MNNQTQLCNMEILIGKCKQLQAELAEKESIIEQMVDVSIVTKLNEEIAEKDKEIERLQGTRPFELLAMACQEIIELKEKLNK